MPELYGRKTVKLDSLGKKQTHTLFLYGTLMFEPVWNRVVGGRYKAAPASISGWKRLRVIGEEYPALVPGSGIIHGVARFDIEPDDVRLLDIFEGDYYERSRCEIVMENDQQCNGWTYVFREEYQHLLDPFRTWDPVHFVEHDLYKFLKRFF